MHLFNSIALKSTVLHLISSVLNCTDFYCIELYSTVILLLYFPYDRDVLQELEVSSPPGEIIGYVRQKWTFIKPK